MSTTKRLSYSLAMTVFTCFYALTGIAGHTDIDISAHLEELEGVWASEGYGHIVHIQNGSPMHYQRFQINEFSCLLLDTAALEFFHPDTTRVLRNADSTRFSYMISGAITTFVYHRIDQLPPLCRNGGSGPDADPLLNFDVFWATMNEHYAFFEQRGVDWAALRDQWRPLLSSSSSEAELFNVLVGLVTPLCDGHVELISGFDEFNGEINPSCSGDFLQHVMDEFQNQTQYGHPFEYFQQWFIPSVLNTVENNYIQGGLNSALLDKILWGDLGGGVGYLNILQMTEYTGPDATPAEDLASLEPVMDSVMESLADKEAVVIDIRLNTGGYDHVALNIADRFVHQTRVALTKKARWNNGFTNKQAHVSSPAQDVPFTRPIVILTSSLTASAAENFLLAMHSLPHVTIVGETTVGVHSDVLLRKLPNGWKFTLSNEVYEAADGTIFEGRGFVPDTEVASPRVEEILAGRDFGIEAALTQLSTFELGPGLNDAWYNPVTDGQGFFITVFPGLKLVSLAWFTYETELPPEGVEANLGNPGHRWLTALGPISGNQSVMNIDMTSGGLFDTPSEVQHTTPVGSDGTMILTFEGCNSGTIEYDIPSINRQGSVPIRRVANDNIALCKMLSGELDTAN